MQLVSIFFSLQIGHVVCGIWDEDGRQVFSLQADASGMYDTRNHKLG